MPGQGQNPGSGRNQKVYVIRHELGPVKIGRAEWPKGRLQDLQVSCPFALTIEKSRTAHDAAAVEKYLHRMFRKYHIRGEWFDIPPADLDFEIPTHINENGVPNTEIGLTQDRDMNHEWGVTLERFYDVMVETKYMTEKLRSVRRQWRDWINRDEGSGIEHIEPPDLGEAVHEAGENEVMCSNCGRHYDPVKSGCPICTSAASSYKHDIR